MNICRLNTAIFNGLNDACHESVRFNQFLYPDIKPEYLLTVNVAQSILAEFQDELIIKIEEQTKSFKKASLGINDLLDFQSNYLKNFNLIKRGRIDIAIHDKDGYSICPIEIKGFNSSKNLIKKDINRIIHFIDSNDSKNSIKYGVSAFLVEHKRCILKSKMNEGVELFEKKYNDFVDLKFGQLKDRLEIKAFCETSYDELLTDEEFNSLDEDNVAETLKEKAHYISVIINVIKK